MTPFGFSARGARVRGAFRLLEVLEKEGHRVWPEGGGLVIEPSDGIQGWDLALLRDLKPELLVLATFSPLQRAAVASVYPEADLSDLEACRSAFDAWEAFTPPERAILDPRLSVRDVAAIGRLKALAGGTLVEQDGSCSVVDPPKRA